MGFKDDLVMFNNDNPLVKAQVFYFFYDAIVNSLPRYLGLYYKHTLLLSPHQVAILLSARYFSLLFGSPFLGSIADKLHRYKNVLIVCMFALLVTYTIIPLIEPVDGFNCQDHVLNHSLTVHNFTHTTSHKKANSPFHLHVHKYESELMTDPLGSKHYHGNLMYDLYYTWPFETFEYLETDKITHKVFIALLVVTLIGEFFASPGETFADLYTLQMLGNENKKYGLQIIPGCIGWLVVSLTFAILTNSKVDLKDDFCHIGHTINYSSYLYVVYAMVAICIFVALLFKYKPKASPQPIHVKDGACQCNFLQALVILSKTPMYAAFAVTVVFAGMGSGIKKLYIYHYISELGGPLFMLPIVTAVHFVSSIIALLLSPYLLSKYGHVNIILVTLFTNGVTFIVYSLIENPWLIFLVEPFDGITILGWVAIVTYTGCPPRIGAALQGLVHGLYKGLGIAIGYLAVSVLILKYGYLALFLSLGLVFFVVFGFYLSIIYYFPKEQTIAEEYSKYSLLPDFIDSDDDNIDSADGDLTNKTGYEYDKLDTSFLE